MTRTRWKRGETTNRNAWRCAGLLALGFALISTVARAEGSPEPATAGATESAPSAASPTEAPKPSGEQNPKAANEQHREIPGSASGPDTRDEAAYARAIDDALLEYERGHFEEAREHLRAAHDIFPNARTLRGLGKVEFELRNYGESVKLLEAAVASEVKPLDAGLRAEVEQILARARAYLGEVHVNVEPGTATVSVDGVAVARGPNAALALVVGDHVLEFRASGHLPERRAIRVKGGERLTVRVVLPEPGDRATVRLVETSTQTQEPVDKPAYKRWWIWTTVGAVVVGSVVTGVLLAKRSDSSEGPVSGGTTGVVIENP